MPVKKMSKRKLKSTGEKEHIPAKIGKKALSLGPEELFIARRFHDRGPGEVLTYGQGDVGQLGLGKKIYERSRPTLVPNLTNVVDVCAGGMHTICLTDTGEVFTFGCNDEGALGRLTAEEDDEMNPGRVTLDGKAVQISAGDSHSAALLEDGRVFAWGAFRDSHGTMGLTEDGIVQYPSRMEIEEKVTRIASGTDHLLMLTGQGNLYTCGCGEQGQLGRMSERHATRENRSGISLLLIPSLVKVSLRTKHVTFDQVWAGGYSTFAREKGKSNIYVFGLNNYKQLGLDKIQCYYHPTLSQAFSDNSWTKICGGQHHTIALDTEGAVYALGRKDYGRLGLGEDCTDVDRPTLIPALQDKKCVDIACGSSVSFAVTEKGEVYAWGMGTSGQLGIGEDSDDSDVFEPTKVEGKQLEGREVVAVSGGGQHTVLLAKLLSTTQES